MPEKTNNIENKNRRSFQILVRLSTINFVFYLNSKKKFSLCVAMTLIDEKTQLSVAALFRRGSGRS